MLSLTPSLLARFWASLSLIVLSLIANLVSPLGAQGVVTDDEFDNDGFIDSFFIPITHRAPFTSGVYLGPDNENGPGQVWEPLSFNGHTYRPFGPSPIPLDQTFTAHPSRAYLEPRGSQSFDIVTPLPPVLPESLFHEPSFHEPSFHEPSFHESSPYESLRESAEPSYAPTDPKPAVAARPQTTSTLQRSSTPRRSEVVSRPGQLTFSVHPADTRVLVNDDLFGTGESLSTGQSRSLKPGVYAIEAEHGQYATERLMFSLRSGESVHVVIDLSAKGEDRGRVDKLKPRSR